MTYRILTAVSSVVALVLFASTQARRCYRLWNPQFAASIRELGFAGEHGPPALQSFSAVFPTAGRRPGKDVRTRGAAC
jgi:hypothetical protein